MYIVTIVTVVTIVFIVSYHNCDGFCYYTEDVRLSAVYGLTKIGADNQTRG